MGSYLVHHIGENTKTNQPIIEFLNRLFRLKIINFCPTSEKFQKFFGELTSWAGKVTVFRVQLSISNYFTVGSY
jgi:hypothetical protein